MHTSLHAPIGHRRHIRSTEQHSTGASKLLNSERVLFGAQRDKGGRSGSYRHAGNSVVVLDGERNAVEWAECFAPSATLIGFSGLSSRIRIQNRHRVQLRARLVKAINAVEVVVDECDTCRCAVSKGTLDVADAGLIRVESVGFVCTLVHRWPPAPTLAIPR